jgi:predicted nucleotidyltransferase
VIERPIEHELDFSGWDLRKTLKLLRKSNPPLLEWLRSPVVYQQQTTAADRLRDLVPTYYSRRASSYHYLHMADKHGFY